MSKPRVELPAADFLLLLERMAEDGQSLFPDVGIQVVGKVKVSPMVFPAPLSIHDVHFLGSVDFGGVTVGGNLHFKTCSFKRLLVLAGARVEGDLNIEGEDPSPFGEVVPTILQAGMDVSLARIDGDLAVRQVHCRGKLSVRGARVEGDVRLEPLEMSDAVNLDFARVGGHLVIDGSGGPVGVSELTGPIRAEGIVVEGDVRMGNIHLDPPVHNQSSPTALNMNHGRVRGDIKLANIDAAGSGSLSHRYLRASGLFLQFSRIAHSVDMMGARVGTLSLFHSLIEGDCTLSGGEFGYIAAISVEVHGTLAMIEGSSGQVRILDNADGVLDTRGAVRVSRLGALIISQWEIQGHAKFELADVGDPRFFIRGSDKSHWPPGIHLDSVVCARSITFVQGDSLYKELEIGGPSALDAIQVGSVRKEWQGSDADGDEESDKLEEDTIGYADPWLGGMRCHGSIVVRNCTVGSSLDLTGVRLVPIETSVGSSRALPTITLDGTRARRILFASPLSAIATPDQAEAALWQESRRRHLLWAARTPKAYRRARMAGKMGAWCGGLSLRRTKAGEIDLTGLAVVKTANAGMINGHMEMSRATVEGTLALALDRSGEEETAAGSVFEEWGRRIETALGELLDPLEREASVERPTGGAEAPPAVWAALVEGGLNLTGAVADELRISGQSFDGTVGVKEGEPGGASDQGVVLDDASIGKLLLLGCRRPPRGNGFPGPLSLRDLKVRSWSFDGSEASRADGFLDFLDNDEVYHEATYAAVEGYLRDRGHAEEARRVYIASRFRRVRVGVQDRDVGLLGRAFRSLARLLPDQRDVPGRGADHPYWRPGLGRLRRYSKTGSEQARHFLGILLRPFYGGRLRRSPLEEVVTRLLLTLVALLALGLCAAVSAAFVEAAPQLSLVTGTKAVSILLLVVVTLFAVILLRRLPSFQLLADRAYWSLLDYGTWPTGLILSIGLLFLITLVGVAQDPKNFEASLALRRAEPEVCRADALCTPAPDDWTRGRRLWVTTQAHVPLADFFAEYDWRPADRPVSFFGFERPDLSPEWWSHLVLGHWPSARTWFGLMTLVNYALWPLFLPVILRRLDRAQRS